MSEREILGSRFIRPDEALHRITDLRLILDAAAGGFYCVDREGITTVCNAAFLRMLGFEGEEAAIGRKLHDVIHHTLPDGSPYAKEQCPIYRIAQHGGSAHVDTESFFRLDGSSFPVEYWVQPILRDGAVQGAVCSFIDITERRQAEAALKRLNETLERRIEERTSQLLVSDAQIRTFYDHSSECHAVMVAVEGGQFRYEDINPATLRLYGMTREQVIGRTVDEVFGTDNAAEVNGHLTACLKAGAPYRYERMQGDSIVEAIASPVPIETGRPRRLVVSARDVTERRRLEQQLRQAQKMEAVGQLTGGIAHDFNNLLTVILGNTEVLRRRLEGDGVPTRHELDRLSGSVLRAAERAASLTHRLLAFSRQQPLAPEQTDVNKLVAGMSEMLRRTLGETVAIEVVLGGGLWRVNADPNQLESAVLNLAINARDAMPGGGKLTIETSNAYLAESADDHEEVIPGQYVLLAVTDTGAGMSAETIAKAFDPFFTTKKIGDGTGLGLSMVYGFVKQSGGHVKIYSELGHGTVVKIYFPRFLGDGSAAAVELISPANFVMQGRREEIVLVVEDDELVRGYSLNVFHELGFDALEAADAASALRIIDERPRIDLLFTDVGLPGGINGRLLADEARKRQPNIKVLFTTGYTRNAIVHNGTLDPGVDLVTKPFTMDALARKILALLPER
jgi:PAS domain S-box-containing protein